VPATQHWFGAVLLHVLLLFVKAVVAFAPQIVLLVFVKAGESIYTAASY
jgi:hypothetical protein